jgi:hypothetical protein
LIDAGFECRNLVLRGPVAVTSVAAFQFDHAITLIPHQLTPPGQNPLVRLFYYFFAHGAATVLAFFRRFDLSIRADDEWMRTALPCSSLLACVKEFCEGTIE